MPELPEVETIVNDLNKKILNKKISGVDILSLKIIKNKKRDFKNELIGNSFENIARRGKLLIFKLKKGDKYLLIHLRMTGQLVYRDDSFGRVIAGGHGVSVNSKLPSEFTRATIRFADGAKLNYNDQRLFGFLRIVSARELEIIKSKFGIEPLDKKFSLQKLSEMTKDKKMNIKAFILNQEHIAGIGNIYADEILWKAGVSPRRTVGSLKTKELKKIFSAIKIILRKAIEKRGTTFNSYVDADGRRGGYLKMLKVYKRENKKCARCGNGIKKIKIAGRGTRFCEKCQK